MDASAERVAAFGRIAAVLCLVGVALWAIIEAVTADPAVAGSIIGSIATAAGAVGAVAYQQGRAEKERIREIHRKRMEPIYEEFIGRASQRFASSGEPLSPEMQTFFAEFQRKHLLLRANPKVIQTYNRWIEMNASESDPLAPARAYESLLRAIRLDLGHRDSRLKQDDLLRLFSDLRKNPA